jgi:hypothetical protein
MFAGSFFDAVQISGAEAVIKLAFEQLENTFIKPSWWHGLSAVEQSNILTHVRSGTPYGHRRTRAAFLGKGLTFPAKVREIRRAGANFPVV